MMKLPMPLTDNRWLVLLRAIVFAGAGVLAYFGVVLRWLRWLCCEEPIAQNCEIERG
jgi:hypothetical protein